MTLADVAEATRHLPTNDVDGAGDRGVASSDDEDFEGYRVGLGNAEPNPERSQYLRSGIGLLNVAPNTLWALLLTHGSRKYTVEMYECVRQLHAHSCKAVLEDAAAIAGLTDLEKQKIRRARRLPHVRTIVRKLRPVVLD